MRDVPQCCVCPLYYCVLIKSFGFVSSWFTGWIHQSQLQVIPILDYACVVWDLHFKKDKELLKFIQLFATHMAAKSWHGRLIHFLSPLSQSQKYLHGFYYITLFSTPPPILETIIINICNSPMLKLCHIFCKFSNSLPESIAACM